MPKIYDNIEHHFTDGLNDTLKVSKRADFCVGYFNLRGWEIVADQIDNLTGEMISEKDEIIHRTCRLLIGMQKRPAEMLRESFAKKNDLKIDNQEAYKLKRQIAEEFRNQLTVGIPTNQHEKTLQKLSRQMKDKKVAVKLFLKHSLHAKLYLAHRNDKQVPIVAFLGSSNLTFSGLSGQGELNIDVVDHDAALKLSAWFDQRWEERLCLDITKELIEIIDESWASEKLKSPYHIYLKIAYHFSAEARAGINGFDLPKIFETELLDFQKKAVLVAAQYLNQRNGVLIGDVVGLGKTITAIALAKLFEDDYFLETLIICPRNLMSMWEDYAQKYKIRAKVISQSSVQKELPKMSRYRLLIIDESHNLRNEEGKRYKAIKEYLQKNESKVILLSATPYNKTYLDLATQLSLFISDETDLGITPEHYIKSLGGFANFQAKHSDISARTIKAFKQSESSEDWRELMRLYLVRRTRSFIKKNYAKTDHVNGRQYLEFSDQTRSYFPDRIAKKVLYRFDPNDENDIYASLYSDKIVDAINNLALPRYGLQGYFSVKPNTSEEADKLLKTFSYAGKRLIGFCRTNLFKRLESSGYSFLLSLSRHILRNYVFIYALENNLRIPIGKNMLSSFDNYMGDRDVEKGNISSWVQDEETFLENAKELYEEFAKQENQKKIQENNSDFFADFVKTTSKGEKIDISLLKDLKEDSKKIIEILKIGAQWNPDQDRQLNALQELLNEHSNEKVLIFTQFADTAKYLENELKKRGFQNMACVTGDSKNPTELAHRFSPKSNKKTVSDEIQVLISTDVLSEGQNLQDSHIIVNYDLPWAIIRLIQRTGRVDRIGQQAEQIICYSFFPEDGLEKIIKLRARLEQRIKENAEVVGSDETFFEGDPINLMDLYNENSGILEETTAETEVDLSSWAYEIWKNAIEKDPRLSTFIPNMPNVSYATKEFADKKNADSVIVYTQTSEDNDVLIWLDSQGKIITESQYAILKAAECDLHTPALPKLENHLDLVEQGMNLIVDQNKTLGGSLGKKNGIRYRVYNKLKNYEEKHTNTLFDSNMLKQIKTAMDDLLKYPLKEYAKESLNRQLKIGITDSQLVDLVLLMIREDRWVLVHSEKESEQKDTQIICSLGLRK